MINIKINEDFCQIPVPGVPCKDCSVIWHHLLGGGCFFAFFLLFRTSIITAPTRTIAAITPTTMPIIIPVSVYSTTWYKKKMEGSKLPMLSNNQMRCTLTWIANCCFDSRSYILYNFRIFQHICRVHTTRVVSWVFQHSWPHLIAHCFRVWVHLGKTITVINLFY